MSSIFYNKINYYDLSLSGEETQLASVLAHYMPILCLEWHTGETFVSGGRDGDIKLWDTRTISASSGKPTNVISSKRQVFAISCRGETLAIGDEQGIALYDQRKGTEPFASFSDFKAPVKALSFKNNLLCSGSDDGQTRVTDVEALKTVYTAKHTDFVRAVAWNTEKNEYMSGGWGFCGSENHLDLQVHVPCV